MSVVKTYACGRSSGFLRYSPDNGTTWFNLSAFDGLGNTGSAGLATSKFNGGFIIFALRDITSSDAIYVSDDFGATKTQATINDPFTGSYDAGPSVIFIDSLTSYVSGREGLHKSIDGGNTYDRVIAYANLPSVSFTSFVYTVAYFSTELSGIVSVRNVSGYDTEYFVTADGGINWTKLTYTGILVTDVTQGVFISPLLDTIVITTVSGIVVSTNSGATFTTVVPFTAAFAAGKGPQLSIVNNNLMFTADGDCNLYKSVNGGVNWTQVSLNYTFGNDDPVGIGFYSETEGYITNTTTDVYKIVGDTVTVVDTGNTLTSISSIEYDCGCPDSTVEPDPSTGLCPGLPQLLPPSSSSGDIYYVRRTGGSTAWGWRGLTLFPPVTSADYPIVSTTNQAPGGSYLFYKNTNGTLLQPVVDTNQYEDPINATTLAALSVLPNSNFGTGPGQINTIRRSRSPLWGAPMTAAGSACMSSTCGSWPTSVLNTNSQTYAPDPNDTTVRFIAPGNVVNFNVPGRLSQIGIWAYDATTSAAFPNEENLSFTYCLNINEAKQYLIGIAGDNYVKIEAKFPNTIPNTTTDYVTIFDIVNDQAASYTKWYILPVFFPVGQTQIRVTGKNQDNQYAFAAEIYDIDFIDFYNYFTADCVDDNCTGLRYPSDITRSSTYTFDPSDPKLKVIFNTADAALVPNNIGQTGAPISYGTLSCPAGYTLSECNSFFVPMCSGVAPGEPPVECPCRLESCLPDSSGNTVIEYTDTVNTPGIDSYIGGVFSDDTTGCWQVFQNDTLVYDLVAKSTTKGVLQNCLQCQPLYLLFDCNDLITPLYCTYVDLSSYLGTDTLIKINNGVESFSQCFKVGLSEELECSTTLLDVVNIVSEYTNCSDCIPPAYQLTTCLEPSISLYTTQDLSMYLGKSVTVIEYPGLCFIVETGTAQVAPPISFTINNIYDDCDCCKQYSCKN